MLDHRVNEGIATRRFRVMKYRGSNHGNNEYPFLINRRGIWAMPVTSVGLHYPVSEEYVSTGVPSLDSMLSMGGYFRGSSVLISGTAGTGKTSLAAATLQAACQRGERSLFFAFEESPDQIIRNMRSIGIDLAPFVESGLLRFQAVRPSHQGPEMHLLSSQRLVDEFKPQMVAIDPINSLNKLSTEVEVQSMLLRLIDYFKVQNITTIFTSLTHGGQAEEATDANISSLMDVWLLLQNYEIDGERNRCLSVLKARGQAHSNQTREFILTNRGMLLIDVFPGPEGVLTGSARLRQEAVEKLQANKRREEMEFKKRELERKRQILQARMETLRVQFEAEQEELERAIEQEEQRKDVLQEYRDEVSAAHMGGNSSPE